MLREVIVGLDLASGKDMTVYGSTLMDFLGYLFSQRPNAVKRAEDRGMHQRWMNIYKARKKIDRFKLRKLHLTCRQVGRNSL